MHGGGVAMPLQYINPRIGAILDVFYPGYINAVVAFLLLTAASPLGGVGIADVIFGNYNPGGRMPITIYNPDVSIQPMTDYNMTQAPGFTYR